MLDDVPPGKRKSPMIATSHFIVSSERIVLAACSGWPSPHIPRMGRAAPAPPRGGLLVGVFLVAVVARWRVRDRVGSDAAGAVGVAPFGRGTVAAQGRQLHECRLGLLALGMVAQ